MVGDQAAGDASEYERATGRTFVYEYADGTIRDKLGNEIEIITPQMMVLKRH